MQIAQLSRKTTPRSSIHFNFILGSQHSRLPTLKSAVAGMAALNDFYCFRDGLVKISAKIRGGSGADSDSPAGEQVNVNECSASDAT